MCPVDEGPGDCFTLEEGDAGDSGALADDEAVCPGGAVTLNEVLGLIGSGGGGYLAE